MAKNRVELFLSSPASDTAYVFLPEHPGKGTSGVTKKQVRLRDIYPDYKGADLYFDFDKDNQLIGIEILSSNCRF